MASELRENAALIFGRGIVTETCRADQTRGATRQGLSTPAVRQPARVRQTKMMGLTDFTSKEAEPPASSASASKSNQANGFAGADQRTDANDADDSDGRPDQTVHPNPLNRQWWDRCGRCRRKVPSPIGVGRHGLEGQGHDNCRRSELARAVGVELGLEGVTWFWKPPHQKPPHHMAIVEGKEHR